MRSTRRLWIAALSATALAGLAAPAAQANPGEIRIAHVHSKTGPLEAPVVLAEALVERVFGPDHPNPQILARFPGAALDGVRYEPPFPYLKGEEYGERGHTVLLGDFVTADDGTGLVHTAIAFGEDDFRLGAQYGLNVVNPVTLEGRYDERIKGYEGRAVREEPYSIDQWRADAASGRLRECFACGTAAVVAPIGKIKSTKGDFVIGEGDGGPITERLKAQLVGVQRGEIADTHGWVRKVL